MLKRTATTQQNVFNAQPQQKRDEDYFRANIGKVKTADDLVNDRRLLRVTLGAFGLEADINNKAFIRKVLAEGTLKEGAFANRLADKQYQKMAAAFGFGDFTPPRNVISGFADKIVPQFRQRGFETAVGTQSGTFRLALNIERELPALANKTGSEDLLWLTVLGNAPMREVFQTAFGLPSSFASVDLDRQLVTLKERASTMFGSDSIRQFRDPKVMENLVRQFVVRADIGTSQSGTRGQAALTLLQNISR
ncbi:MAG: DUF1217 domain-containing protein [Paracoccaceae bacterium]